VFWQQYHFLVAQGVVNSEEGIMQELAKQFNDNKSMEA
jgi:hypothetical protein